MEGAAFAEVIVNQSNRDLDRVFHYAVPEAMRPLVAVGKRVRIPFGRRQIEGIIVGLASETPVTARDLLAVLDPEPVIPPVLIEVATRMAAQYLCPLAEALKAVMPPALHGKEKSRVVLTPLSATEEQEIVLGLGLDTQALEVWQRLRRNGSLSWETLTREDERVGVEVLIRRGLARVERNWSPQGAVKKGRMVTLTVALDSLPEIMKGLARKAPRQKQVLEYLAQYGEAPLNEVLAATEAGGATVAALEGKEYIKISQREIHRDPLAGTVIPSTLPLPLSQEQEQAAQAIRQAVEREQATTFLLHGVTGSGKTEIYLQAIAGTLEMGKQAIVLVPEISLTSQTVERFVGRFGRQVAVLHSALSVGERYDEWRRIREGQVGVVVGARSAIFAPLSRLGLIVVDEEHESSYKQEVNPKYHAREVAQWRGRMEGAPVVLGSATPSLESYYRAQSGEYVLLSLPDRATQQPLPTIHVVDLREEFKLGNRSIFSRLLQEKMAQRLQRREQIILFLNRRGFSTFIICRECGEALRCPHCDIPLTYHKSGDTLRCHYCNHRQKSPQHCPHCGSSSIRYFGSGTQRVEEEVHRLFPGITTLRMDVDTTGRKGAHSKILDGFRRGEAQVLVGTQMIAKGLDFPEVTLVGVVSADNVLNLPDFRAAERTFQILTQVAGRSGRHRSGGEVVVQTYAPENYAVRAAQDHDYLSFYHHEISLRRGLDYPPFTFLIRFLLTGPEEEMVMQSAQVLARELKQVFQGNMGKDGVELLGPAPASLPRLQERYRWQLVLKGPREDRLRQGTRQGVAAYWVQRPSREVTLSIDVDPLGVL